LSCASGRDLFIRNSRHLENCNIQNPIHKQMTTSTIQNDKQPTVLGRRWDLDVVRWILLGVCFFGACKFFLGIKGLGSTRWRLPAVAAAAAAHRCACRGLRKVAATYLAAGLVAPLAGEARLARMFFLHLTGIFRHIDLAGQAGDVDPGHHCPPFAIIGM
jgi:hypothetical protein